MKNFRQLKLPDLRYMSLGKYASSYICPLFVVSWHTAFSCGGHAWYGILSALSVTNEELQSLYIRNYYCSDYKARLISLHLLLLMYWFKLHNIMFLVKCMKDPADNLDISSYISFVSSCTRTSSAAKLKHNLGHKINYFILIPAHTDFLTVSVLYLCGKVTWLYTRPLPCIRKTNPQLHDR